MNQLSLRPRTAEDIVHRDTLRLFSRARITPIAGHAASNLGVQRLQHEDRNLAISLGLVVLVVGGRRD